MGDGNRPLAGRRQTLKWLGAMLMGSPAWAQVTSSPVTRHASPVTPFAPVVPGYLIRFPQDEGSHPAFRIEWWYITGWLNEASTRPLGFQITFFRARPDLKQDNPSAFTPRHIMIAHAALSDPARGRLIHSQRAARAGFGLAGAEMDRMRVWIDDWVLERRENRYRARISGEELQFDFTFDSTQPPLLQGENGFSRKGPDPESASYYYSIPQLQVGGTVRRGGKSQRVTGRAWLDHEWSSSYLPQEAAGWDWIGISLDDGGALMAFRMRDRKGGSFWAGGTVRDADGGMRVFPPGDVQFTVRREWHSARTGTSYPVSMLVRAGDREVMVEPLMDDQEADTRASTGAIYWEGAVRALSEGRAIGRGYLELTGYGSPLRL